MKRDIKDQYNVLLHELEENHRLSPKEYMMKIREASDAAFSRIAVSDSDHHKVCFPAKGIPGLNDIALAIVVHLMDRPVAQLPDAENLYPDLMYLFFIAGEYSDICIEQADEWRSKMSREQLVKNPEIEYLWRLLINDLHTLTCFKASLLDENVSEHRWRLLNALEARADKTALEACNSIANQGKLPGWGIFPFTRYATNAYLLRQ